MRGTNIVVISGRLGKNPELRKTRNGQSVSEFSVACGQSRRRNGEWVDETEWFRVATFGGVAEACSTYLKKGDPVIVEGSICTEQWEDAGGNKRYTTKIYARNVNFLSTKSSANKDASGPNYAPVNESHATSAPASSSTSVVDDDDIPF